MAKIIFSDNGEEIEIREGEQIKEVCEKFGVPFSCTEGICGTCMIDILEGEKPSFITSFHHYVPIQRVVSIIHVRVIRLRENP